MSPERKREAVLHLQESFCASERRACRVIKQPRATQRYRGARRDKDAPLIAALRRVSESRPRAGYRVAAAHLRREGNGPEFIAAAVRDWIRERGFKTLYIAPGSPWENPYSESFNSRFRDEFLNRESFGSLLEAKVLGKEHRHDYNHRRLHSSLGYQTPAEFCAALPDGSLRYAPAAVRQRPTFIPTTTRN